MESANGCLLDRDIETADFVRQTLRSILFNGQIETFTFATSETDLDPLAQHIQKTLTGKYGIDQDCQVFHIK